MADRGASACGIRHDSQRRARALRDRLSGPQLLDAIGVAALAGTLYRQWRQNQSLPAQLEAAATELQHFQETCSRLAPAGVVQRLVADGVKPGTESLRTSARSSRIRGNATMLLRAALAMRTAIREYNAEARA